MDTKRVNAPGQNGTHANNSKERRKYYNIIYVIYVITICVIHGPGARAL